MKSRTTGIVIGAVAGALLGLLVAWIILDRDEADMTTKSAGKRPRAVTPTDVVSLASAALGLVRQVSNLRQR